MQDIPLSYWGDVAVSSEHVIRRNIWVVTAWERMCSALPRKQELPVFSHDELLITITQQSQSIKTASWYIQYPHLFSYYSNIWSCRLVDSLGEMIEREMGSRAFARSLGLGEILECHCKTEVVCVDHAELLCDHSVSQLTLRKRFSDTTPASRKSSSH